MTQEFLKPAPGLKTRKPDGSYLPAKGDWVPMTTYWLRRKAEGDVVAATPPKTKRAPK